MSQDQTTWPVAAQSCCRHLRSKPYYMDLPFHSSGMESGMPVPCWCFKTQQALGPDGSTVSTDECGASRACFEKDAF